MSSERSALSLKDAKATRALVIANIVIFAILRLAPGAREALLLDPAAVWAKPWTLVTVFFAHELPLHLVVNLAILVAFGSRLESRAGAGITSFATRSAGSWALSLSYPTRVISLGPGRWSALRRRSSPSSARTRP